MGDVLQSVANELARIYSQELAPMEDNLFLSTATGDHLDALCGNYSIQRQENESDDSLRARALRLVRQPAMAGNAAHYTAWAMEVPGVAAARGVAGIRGSGTVDVYYVPTQTPPADLWNRLQQHLQDNCPLTAQVLAVEATPCSLSVEAAVTLRDTALETDVQLAFAAALEDYCSRIALTDQGCRISPGRLTAILLDCAGVMDVNSLTINGRAATLTLPEGSYPVPTALVLTKVLSHE